MLFPGKKCRNSRHQRVVLCIAAFFIISYPALSVLLLPFQVNKPLLMLQFSSLSLISLTISQSLLLLFLMPLLLPV